MPNELPTELELVRTPLRRYTFQAPKMKEWVERNSFGKVLNLFAGWTRLALDETRIDLDPSMPADEHVDALQFLIQTINTHPNQKWNTVILDPPYSYRKSIEMYQGNYTSKFKLIADRLSRVTTSDCSIISFGYHSSFMGGVRDFYLQKLCVFAHGGAQHCTIGIVEKRRKS
jgi:hypothetical protein